MTPDNKNANSLRHEEQAFVRQAIVNGYRQHCQGHSLAVQPSVVIAISLMDIERNPYTERLLNPNKPDQPCV